MPDIAAAVHSLGDGSVVINLDVHRTSALRDTPRSSKFDENLAEDALGQDALATIATEVIDGINADIRSREDWVKNYNRGLELLGLKLEDRGEGDKTSTVRAPLLLWSIVKFQSLTQGEMLPSDGPVKIKNDGNLPNNIADDLEVSMNHYILQKDVGYYADTDRGLFYLGYGGTIFKKIYRCPIRRKPVSECVYLPDLIVSQDATDIQTANRVTHQMQMLQQDVAKYQRMGHWRDVQLAPPTVNVSATDTAEAKVTGISATIERWQDQPRTVWECYTTLDLGRWGEGETDQEDGYELPYRVTVDRDSRQILEIRRNWREGDPLRAARRRFVPWGLVPGIGFLSLGYLHLLGNHTRALTGLERIVIDGGMFANFPGGVRVKGARMETNEIRPGPGEFPEIDTGGLPIQDAIMKLPYAAPDAVMLDLIKLLQEQGEGLVGAVEVAVGEGKADVPVGTIMAQIEQATQIMTAIHKRLHRAQKEEFQIWRELLCDQPELLVIPGRQANWTPEQLKSASLVPASDPNVPAHIHRIMQAIVLEQLGTAHPDLYDAYEVQKRILQTARIINIDDVLHKPAPQGQQQDPNVAIAEAELKIAGIKAQIEKMKTQARLAEAASRLSVQREVDQTKNSLAAGRLQQEDQHHIEDLADKAADRISREKIAEKTLATDADLQAQQAQTDMDLARIDAEQQHSLAGVTASHDQAAQALDLGATAQDAALQRQHEKDLTALQPAPTIPPEDTTP